MNAVVTSGWEVGAVHALEEALESLRRDRARTRAGLFCVAAGMAIIVSLSAIVAGGRREMLRSVEAAGPANLFLKSIPTGGGRPLTTADLAVARLRFPDLQAAAGIRFRRVAGATPLGGPIPLYAVTRDFDNAFKLSFSNGRPLAAMDGEAHSRIAVVGPALARRVAPQGMAVGRRLELGGAEYQVVGVLAPATADSGAGVDLVGVDWERGAFVPLGSEPGRVVAPDDRYPISMAVFRFTTPERAREASAWVISAEVEKAGRRLEVTLPVQALEQHRATHRSLDRLALLVSLLSALASGAGIRNLLRSSVTERTTEIGLRRAVGARAGDIRRQLLAEGILLGVGGGLLGMAAGVLISLLVLARAGWSPYFEPAALLGLSLGSAVFGLASGLGPAAEAARLDPAVALRAE